MRLLESNSNAIDDHPSNILARPIVRSGRRDWL